jgi:uncharacterized membrane protein YebE (DUF533 family)
MKMNITDLLGAVMQSGMSPSSGNRMKNALGGGGGGGLLESLSGMLGGQSPQGGGLGSILSQALGGGSGSGGLGGILGNVLNEAGNAVGGKQNLALGGLGALAGALLGGGGKSLGGALGGGVMALLGTMAYQALKGAGSQPSEVPLGLVEPQSEAERQALEQNAEIVLKAMINAAKADGQIDRGEVQRIVGKLKETGMAEEAQQYVMTEMQKPIDTPALVAAVRGQPALAAQIFAASLLAIEVDTPAEKKYLDQLEVGLGLQPEVAQRIKEMVGLQA